MRNSREYRFTGCPKKHNYFGVIAHQYIANEFSAKLLKSSRDDIQNAMPRHHLMNINNCDPTLTYMLTKKIRQEGANKIDKMNRNKVIQNKIDLYISLLELEPDKMTDSDIDLAYQLAKDEEIQNSINKNRNRKTDTRSVIQNNSSIKKLKNKDGEFQLFDFNNKFLASTEKFKDYPLINKEQVSNLLSNLKIKNFDCELFVEIEMENNDNELFPLPNQMHLNKKNEINILRFV